jgi:hypothetical protein
MIFFERVGYLVCLQDRLRAAASMPSQISRSDIVSATTSPRVNLGGDRVDMLAIAIERPQDIVFFELQIRLKLLERVRCQGKRALH